jgi:hypothetical protein
MEGMSILPYLTTMTGNWTALTIKEDIRIRICIVLSGVIEDHHLKDLRHDIWLPLALIILQIYNDFTKESDKDTVCLTDEIRRVYYSCQEMPTMRSPQENILFTLFHLAVKASQYCQLRVDEAGQSICSGQIVAQVQFWSLELFKPTRARIWFRYKRKRTEPPGESIVMIELEADEVSDIFSRMRFLGQGEWETGSGCPKAIKNWGRLWSRGGSHMIVENKTFETYDMAAYRFELEDGTYDDAAVL